jgi:hypothetical protein
LKKSSAKKDTPKRLNERIECGEYYFKSNLFSNNHTIFKATVVASYFGETTRILDENFGIFLVKGKDKQLSSFYGVDGIYTVNSDYLVGKVTPLMETLL